MTGIRQPLRRGAIQQRRFGVSLESEIDRAPRAIAFGPRRSSASLVDERGFRRDSCQRSQSSVHEADIESGRDSLRWDPSEPYEEARESADPTDGLQDLSRINALRRQL
jgi:hypothetical protein